MVAIQSVTEEKAYTFEHVYLQVWDCDPENLKYGMKCFRI